MPPPALVAVLPVTVQLLSVTVEPPPSAMMPPPPLFALLPEIVQLRTTDVAYWGRNTPAPPSPAVLPESVQFSNRTVPPPNRMAPPPLTTQLLFARVVSRITVGAPPWTE